MKETIFIYVFQADSVGQKEENEDLSVLPQEPVSNEDELEKFRQQCFTELGSNQPAANQGATATAMVEGDGATVEVKPYI